MIMDELGFFLLARSGSRLFQGVLPDGMRPAR